MKHLFAEKYTIAWFKLAEFVARGEKERALGMYRLLMHSIDDRALALQLEGDLLIAFNDTIASERYRAAAQYYMNENRFIEAVSVYEHLKVVMGCTEDDFQNMANLYQRLEYTQRLVTCLHELLLILASKDLFDQALSIIEEYKTALHGSQIASLHYTLIDSLIISKKSSMLLTAYIINCLRSLIEFPSDQALQAFLLSLETIHPKVHKEAVTIMENL